MKELSVFIDESGDFGEIFQEGSFGMKKKILFVLAVVCVLGLGGCAFKEKGEKISPSIVKRESTTENETDVYEDTKYISIDLSTVKETHIEGEDVTPLNLKIISEEENGIDFANDWYNSKNFITSNGW